MKLFRTIMYQESSKRIGEKHQIVRFQPELLTYAISFLTEDQKKWINETGFGPILFFSTREDPVEICLFILNSYKPYSSSLLVNGENVHIDEEDV